MNRVQPGDVLVADMTDPDWEPVMKRASAIVTNRGGRTCHAAIIARELGVPAVVGCGDATDLIADGAEVTVSCAEGDTGYIYAGALPFEHTVTDLGDMPKAPLKIMMNVGNPNARSTSRSCPIRALVWRVWNSSSRARSASIPKHCWNTASSPPISAARSMR
jgi:phosphoenolpyruvate synthase/pyruvate phosphate dikinase